mmetsp:Transcript_18234/g.35679  ORF Transcript_18234/g.35679 Transcript_18234/m.35679 type:complete len:223 (+) Transcript_18234:427-1095(+)
MQVAIRLGTPLPLPDAEEGDDRAGKRNAQPNEESVFVVPCRPGRRIGVWLLIDPPLPRIKTEVPSQEVPHQLGSGLRAPLRQNSLSVPICRGFRQQIVVLERSEHVLGNNLAPHVGVVVGAVPFQMPKRAEHVRPLFKRRLLGGHPGRLHHGVRVHLLGRPVVVGQADLGVHHLPHHAHPHAKAVRSQLLVQQLKRDGLVCLVVLGERQQHTRSSGPLLQHL